MKYGMPKIIVWNIVPATSTFFPRAIFRPNLTDRIMLLTLLEHFLHKINFGKFFRAMFCPPY